MTKEKKKALYFDTDIKYPKLKFLYESKSKGYKTFNVVTDDGASVYSSPFEELTIGCHVFISEDKIEEIVNRIVDHRLGPLLNNKNANY